jgi:uncharacterized protein YecE (DUF72 family)
MEAEKEEFTPRIRVGTAGWSYEDWEGVVYPSPPPRRFDRLAYLSQYFDVLEINNTFYRPPLSQNSESWVRRISHNKRFMFTLKLHRKFTHEREGITGQDEVVFKKGIEPIYEAGRLGAILVQFPWSFKYLPSNRRYLAELIDTFSDYPLVIEVRNAWWDNDELYSFLEKERVGFCNIDQPRLRRQLRPTERATSRVGYVRLHGQNIENWFKEDAGRDQRYNYLYSMEELDPWVKRIRAIADQAEDTYVITNNHYRGQAVVNALQLQFLLREQKVAAPDSLQAIYPQLKEVSKATPTQETLF